LKSLGYLFLLVGAVMLAIQYGATGSLSTQQTIYTFIIKNQAGVPVVGAQVYVDCAFGTGGSIPYEGISDSTGTANVAVMAGSQVLLWQVVASGYTTFNGTGTPSNPQTVTLASGNSASVSGGVVSTVAFPLVTLGGFVFAGLGVVLVWRGKREAKT
jgi:hypothetical protein